MSRDDSIEREMLTLSCLSMFKNHLQAMEVSNNSKGKGG